MDSKLAKLANYKQIAGIAVAAIILTVIFVPFQTASAFEVKLDLPGVDKSAVPISAVGSTFQLTIDVAPGELVAVSSIQLILDNTKPTVKEATFTKDSGSSTSPFVYSRASGDSTLTRGNLKVTIPSPTITAYGYGYGYVISGTSFGAPYSYSFVSPRYDFISGNTVGYSNPIGTAVTSFVGNGVDKITIEGKINTALLDLNVDHTLDVVIDVGTGVDPRFLLAPQLTFKPVLPSSGSGSIQTVTVSTGTVTVDPTSITNIPAGKLKIILKGITVGGGVAIQAGTPAEIKLLAGLSTIFKTVGTNDATFEFKPSGAPSTSTIKTAGKVFEIDTSELSFGTGGELEITVPYDVSLLPSGITEDNLLLFHWTGTAWEDITKSIDKSADTITGVVKTTSPIVTGFVSETGTTPTTPTTISGSSDIVIVNETFSPDYFKTRPLDKLQITAASFVDNQGNAVFGGNVGQQLTIQSSFKNFQQSPQTYAIIIQVIDQNGFTTDIGWVEGVVGPGERVEGSRSLTLEQAGNYQVRMFVWDGVSAAPTALSMVTERSLTATS